MKVRLLYKEKDGLGTKAYPGFGQTKKDLNLELIFNYMSRYEYKGEKYETSGVFEDLYMLQTVEEVIRTPLESKEEILYRQEMLDSVIKNGSFFTQLYRIGKHNIDQLENGSAQTKKIQSQWDRLKILFDGLEEIRNCILDHLDQIRSGSMRNFVGHFLEEYSDTYMVELKQMIQQIQGGWAGGEIEFYARFGMGFKLKDIRIRKFVKGEQVEGEKNRLSNIMGSARRSTFLKNRKVLVDESARNDANILSMLSMEKVLEYFQGFIKDTEEFIGKLTYQLAFYVGCYNLYQRLERMNLSVSMPKPIGKKGAGALRFVHLYEMVLGVSQRMIPIASDLDGKGKRLHIIMGENQGGKSTFLRSIGIAQVMMQAGMFVPAKVYENSIHASIFTHFPSQRDEQTNVGGLEDELRRMNQIVEEIQYDSLLLLNDTFSTTTQKEGGEIAKSILEAFYEKGIQVIMVTHLFLFAQELYKEQRKGAIFLGTRKGKNGELSYEIVEAEPSCQGNGMKLYESLVSPLEEKSED